jgi:8-oxo-dGTP pyrophosphatase MutT (NUDIX family)
MPNQKYPDIVRVALLDKNGEDNQLKVLLVQRSAEEVHHPNKYELPGGNRKLNEYPEETAVRELWEETGITAVVSKKFVIKNQGVRARSGEVDGYTQWLYVTNTFSGTPTPNRGQPEKNEVQAVAWVPLEEILTAWDITSLTRRFLNHKIFRQYTTNS